MVDCENRVRLDAYHDGELSPAERSDVEAHLRDCPSCAAELAAIRRMSGAFADTTPREPSHEQLLRLARSVRAEPSDARMLLRLFRGTAVAAAVLILLGIIGWYLIDTRRAEARSSEFESWAKNQKPVAVEFVVAAVERIETSLPSLSRLERNEILRRAVRRA